jgi:hypothetical protein|tara:strand:+ start:16054 stop:16194 length:141 start_codon:yes stop_codon:yes gene_type:complete
VEQDAAEPSAMQEHAFELRSERCEIDQPCDIRQISQAFNMLVLPNN